MTRSWLFTTLDDETQRVFVHASVWIEARKIALIVLQRGPDQIGSLAHPILRPDEFFVPKGSQVAMALGNSAYEVFLTEEPMCLAETLKLFQRPVVQTDPQDFPLIFPEVSVSTENLYVNGNFILTCQSLEQACGAKEKLEAVLRAWVKESIFRTDVT